MGSLPEGKEQCLKTWNKKNGGGEGKKGNQQGYS